MMRMASLSAAILLLCANAFAQVAPATGKATPPAPPAAAAPPHDRHDGMSVSADPYTDPARVKEKFGKANPLAVGILPIEVVMRNETSEPLRVDLRTVQLEFPVRGGRLQGIDWLAVGDVAIMIAHPKGTPAPEARRFPIAKPVPQTDSKTMKMAEMLQPMALDTDLVPPNGMIHGFLFFEVGHDLSFLANASLYVPDVVSMQSKKPLIFFEVPLGQR